jgi:hypothetical protein
MERLRRVLWTSLAASAVFSTAHAQSIADLTGLTALRGRLGVASTPDGSGVRVGQVEAPAPGYAPDAAHPELVGRSYYYLSPTPSTSAHATAVAQYFFGSLTSISPGPADIDCYEANHWLGTGFLNGSGAIPPQTALFKVLNNSWIGGGGSSANIYLRKLDFAIETQGLLVAAGVNNGSGTLDVPLLSHGFNGLAVGRSDGQHRAGPTLSGFDRPGRMKPEIVAPAGATSFSTPLVSGAASLLVETARTWPSLASNPAAQRPEVIKAALLAGAEHRFGWSNGAPTSGPSRGDTSMPLDPLWGADELDVNHSHWILTGGSQPSSSLAASAAPVAHAGWEYVATTAATSRFWRFEVESTKPFASILATWNRQTAANFGSFSRPEFDLELWSIDSNGALTSLVGDSGLASFAGGNVRSASAVDNLEHLYVTQLQPGSYVLELRRTSDLLAPWNVAVAWELRCADPVPYGTGKLTSLGQEARLGFEGFASEAQNDFELAVTQALPNVAGVAFWGLAAANTPFQGGVKYVASPTQRMGLVQTDATGRAAIGVPIDPTMLGQTRYYQFWFRDPAHPDGTSVGLTNGLAVSFCR